MKKTAKWATAFMTVFCFLAFIGAVNIATAQEDKPKVLFLTSPEGQGAYYVGFKLASIINRVDPTIVAQAKEGHGSSANIAVLMKDAKLRTSLIANGTDLTAELAEIGHEPYETTYSKATGSSLKTVFSQYNMLNTFCTLDPDIKTIHDLVGKRVSFWEKGNTSWVFVEALLKRLGLFDKIKIQYLGFKGGVDALKDGQVDAQCINLTYDSPHVFSAIPAFTELLLTKKVYFVSLGDPKMIREAGKDVGLRAIPLRCTGKVRGHDLKSTVTFLHGATWHVDARMNDEVVYKVLKVLYDNIEEVRKTNPGLKAVDAKRLGWTMTESDFHPGALRFFRDKSLAVGFENGIKAGLAKGLEID